MRNAGIDWFRAVRVFFIGLGQKSFFGGKEEALTGTPLGREASPLLCFQRGSGLRGNPFSLPIVRELLARGLVLQSIVRKISIIVILLVCDLIGFNPVSAETPAVTSVRTGQHEFGYRLVLDVTSIADFTTKFNEDDRSLIIDFPNIDWFPSTYKVIPGNWLIERYDFDLKGKTGGTLTVKSSTSLKIIKSFTLSPSGNAGHRLVFDLAESPGVLTTGVGLRRDKPSMIHGTKTMVSTEPSPQAPTVNLMAKANTLSAYEGGLIGGGKDPLSASVKSDAVKEITLKNDNEKRLILESIMIDDLTVEPKETFVQFYKALIGKPISLKQLNAVAKEMTAMMRNKGYMLYKIIVPEQEVNAGQVRLQAIEGFINEVIIEGEVNGRQDLWKQWAEKITNSRPIKAEVLERYTLIANDLAGATVKTVLRPAKDIPGASDLILKVAQKSIDASISFDNRASKTTGPQQGTAVVSANNLIGAGEKITITYNATSNRKRQETISPQLEIPINSEGTIATISGSVSKSAPGDSLKELGLNSMTKKISANLSHPFIKRRDETLQISGGFNLTNAISDALSSRLYEDNIRAINGGINYTLKDKFEGENNLNINLMQGVDLFGGEQNNPDFRSRSNGQTNFTKLTLGASRVQKMPQNTALSATFSGQWSSKPLLSSEEFSFGGSSFGRAYDSSEITGDHGMAFALELQYTVQPEVSYVRYLQPYTFWDVGMTWDIDADDEERQRSAASTGLGIRLGLNDYFSAGMELAKPLTRPVSSVNDGEGNDPRVFFNLSGKY